MLFTLNAKKTATHGVIKILYMILLRSKHFRKNYFGLVFNPLNVKKHFIWWFFQHYVTEFLEFFELFVQLPKTYDERTSSYVYVL